LQQHFNDWKALRLRLKENFNGTREKQDAIDCFQSTGF
jgi:hypothetical protein